MFTYLIVPLKYALLHLTRFQNESINGNIN